MKILLPNPFTVKLNVIQNVFLAQLLTNAKFVSLILLDKILAITVFAKIGMKKIFQLEYIIYNVNV